MPSIKWIRPEEERPPVKEHLLLIVDAAGSPPDAQLLDKSEVLVGYWTGSSFRAMVKHPNEGWSLNVRYWAKITHILVGTR
jgi:hypothetical protein